VISSAINCCFCKCSYDASITSHGTVCYDYYTNLRGMKATAFMAKDMFSLLFSIHPCHRAEEIVCVPNSYIHTNIILHKVYSWDLSRNSEFTGENIIDQSPDTRIARSRAKKCLRRPRGPEFAWRCWWVCTALEWGCPSEKEPRAAQASIVVCL
jgi:hypothetical protein